MAGARFHSPRFTAECLHDRRANGLCERGRDRIADLVPYVVACPDKYEVVREGLQPSGIAMCDRPVCLRMEVPALLRLEKLGPNRERWPVPP